MDNSLEELERQIRRHIPRSRDPILVIMKGHLLVEERLHGIIETAVRTPSRLKNARLTFYQSACLCEAICGTTKQDLPWRFVYCMNEVRNRLAHRLEPGDMNTLVDGIIVAHEGKMYEAPSSQVERIRWLKNVIVLNCGILEGFRFQRSQSREEMKAAYIESMTRSRRGD